MDRVAKTIKYLERRITRMLGKVDALAKKRGEEIQAITLPGRIAGELSLVLRKLTDDERGIPTRILFCPECGWETAATTPRGRVRMIKKHSDATGHKKFVPAFVRRPEEVPF